jgi:hypothetical protein
MRLSNLFHFCLLGLASAASWRLDKSCKENGKSNPVMPLIEIALLIFPLGLEDMVVAATESAYSMAKNLQASIEDASNKKEISANNGQVIEWMFMPDDHSYKTSYQVMQATGKLNRMIILPCLRSAWL